MLAGQRGIPIVDEAPVEVTRDDNGVTGLRLESGRTLAADLYLDASGPQSLLLGKRLAEPFSSYEDALFCDRAVVGAWQRVSEPIQPYTTAETMDAGWCWQIEHDQRISRGYVYSSGFKGDGDAETEFRASNPKVQSVRTLAFRSGRHERFWVKNVVGIGSAAAYVEPLEATVPAAIGFLCQNLADALADCDLQPTRTSIYNFNRQQARFWDATRDFLAVHYRFNGRLDTPFWRACREQANLHWAQRLVDFYQENGPSVLWRRTLADETDLHEFGMEGYLALLIGQDVPHRSKYVPSEEDRANWAKIQQSICNRAASAFTVPEALALVRSAFWGWPERLYDRPLLTRP